MQAGWSSAAAGGSTGTLPSLNLPAGWSATLATSGNNRNLVVTSRGKTPLQNWTQTYFGTTEATGNAANDADPDGDGVPHLIEYALGGSPTSPTSRPLPTVGTTSNRLTLSFTPQVVSGLRFIVEASTDLVDWTTQTDVTNLVAPGQDNIHADSADLGSSNSRRFLRLRIVPVP